MAKANSNFLDGSSHLLPRPADWRPAASPGPGPPTLLRSEGLPLQAPRQPRWDCVGSRGGGVVPDRESWLQVTSRV